MVSRSLKEVLKTPHSLRMRRKFLEAILLYSTQLTVTITSRVLSMDLLNWLQCEVDNSDVHSDNSMSLTAGVDGGKLGNA